MGIVFGLALTSCVLKRFLQNTLTLTLIKGRDEISVCVSVSVLCLSSLFSCPLDRKNLSLKLTNDFSTFDFTPFFGNSAVRRKFMRMKTTNLMMTMGARKVVAIIIKLRLLLPSVIPRSTFAAPQQSARNQSEK